MGTQVDIESCANCGQTIGKLETPYIWRDNTVCGDCYARVSKKPHASIEDRELERPPANAAAINGCPQCGGFQTLRCATAFDAGTSKGKFGGIGLSGAVDSAFGGVSSQQTLMAKRCAPPAKPPASSVWLGVLAVIICFATLLIVAGMKSDDYTGRNTSSINEGLFVGLAISAAVGFAAWKVSAKDTLFMRAWELQVEKWNQQWICQQCGTIFFPTKE